MSGNGAVWGRVRGRLRAFPGRLAACGAEVRSRRAGRGLRDRRGPHGRGGDRRARRPSRSRRVPPALQAAAYGRCVQASTAPGGRLAKDLCAPEFEALRRCFAAAVGGRPRGTVGRGAGGARAQRQLPSPSRAFAQAGRAARPPTAKGIQEAAPREGQPPSGARWPSGPRGASAPGPGLSRAASRPFCCRRAACGGAVTACPAPKRRVRVAWSTWGWTCSRNPAPEEGALGWAGMPAIPCVPRSCRCRGPDADRAVELGGLRGPQAVRPLTFRDRSS